MGSSLSRGKSSEVFSNMSDKMAGVENSSLDEAADGNINGYVMSGYMISPELLNQILSYVLPPDLVRSGRLVCKNWRNAIDDHDPWRLKCSRRKITIPRQYLNSIPKYFYRNVVFKQPYGRNLIRNPCGSEQLRHWLITHGGDGWIVETPPHGAHEVTTVAELNGINSCFATSFQECKKSQLIDLLAEGLQEEVLDQWQPHIIISDWFAARFDCASTYSLSVGLLNGNHELLQGFEPEPVTIPQWTGNEWHKVQHVFKQYGPGVRHIQFEHSGRDRQFWAGHYGIKITGSSVQIQLQ